jgi:hypothetical protein
MYGAQTKLGIARQASVGSWVTDAGSYNPLPFTSDNTALSKEELISQNLIGRFEQGATYDGVSNVAGTLEFEITPRNLVAVLQAAVNNAPTVATSGSVKTRTFLPNTVDFNSTFCKAPYSFYKQFSDATSAELFYDCQFGQLDLIFSTGQFTKGRAAIVGGTRLANGIASLAITPDASDVVILHPWNVASVSVGGAAVLNYSEITVSLNENIAPLRTLNGTLAPFKYTRTGFREVTVSGTLYMSDRQILNDFVAGTVRRLLITSISTRSSIQSGYYDSLVVDVPQMKYTAVPLPVNGPGEVSVSFTGRGTIDPSSGYSVQFTHTSTFAPTLA